MKRQSRIVIRLLLLTLILAAIFPFTFPLRDGRPLLDWRKISLPNGPELPEVALPPVDVPGDEESRIVTLYKWRDRQGVVQFTGEPPAKGTPFERMAVDPNTNMIQAYVPPEPLADAGEEETEAEDEELKPPTSPLDVYDQEQIKKIIDKAKRVEKLMQERAAQQEQVLNEL
jgi:hypothetical protein